MASSSTISFGASSPVAAGALLVTSTFTGSGSPVLVGLEALAGADSDLDGAGDAAAEGLAASASLGGCSLV